ncbi:hypothetical protein ANANG_G00166640 [Anguilla anguilla]|uniref:Uncharacterized protein n=1 Tax=Anguilla anguilla TaxID=7936 RepID=A0A9D3MCK1_ANGAN|nr:hypothetical protein ANANG_G00166640 [Anguilla anguilla]
MHAGECRADMQLHSKATALTELGIHTHCIHNTHTHTHTHTHCLHNTQSKRTRTHTQTDRPCPRGEVSAMATAEPARASSCQLSLLLRSQGQVTEQNPASAP